MILTSTDKEAQQAGIKVLVYGRAGTGKTTLCGTAPAPLIISAEAGLLSLAHKSIPVIKIENLDNLWAAYTWISTDKRAAQFKTICIDSISEIGEVVLAAAKKKNRDPRQAYGTLIEDMIAICKAFRNLAGKHVVVTAKEAVQTNPVTGVVRYSPKAPGNTVGPELPYLFDEVFHMDIGKDNEGKSYHYIRCKADFQVEAKDRSGKLDEILYPDLTQIFQTIERK